MCIKWSVVSIKSEKFMLIVKELMGIVVDFRIGNELSWFSSVRPKGLEIYNLRHVSRRAKVSLCIAQNIIGIVRFYARTMASNYF